MDSMSFLRASSSSARRWLAGVSDVDLPAGSVAFCAGLLAAEFGSVAGFSV
jgi:hypothetical protein